MNIGIVFRAAVLGLGLAFAGPFTSASADYLRVVRSGANSALNVPMNRAVVVESDVPFAELSIANPAIADISSLSDRSIYVLGKSPGTTTLTLFDGNGQLITNVDVLVAPDLTEFKQRLQQILPGEKIEVRSANDGIVLSGTVSSITRLERALELAERYAPERVTNMMGVGGVQQVMLKVRFAEVKRTVAKQLGTSLAIKKGDSRIGIGLGTTSTNHAGILSGGLPSNGSSQGAMNLNTGLGPVELGVLLEALENKGLVRTLAEPNLTALSGQEAHFLAGGEYPLPVVGKENTVTVEYKPFGVQMTFIPRVLDDGVINLELQTRVSAIDTSNAVKTGTLDVNAFSVREATTTVEMRDGESFSIAGLLQDDFKDITAQVPWVSDIPVLGALFRSADYRREQSELVIIVTPHLVTPTRGEALALPTDRVKPPSEHDLFLKGRTAKEVRRGPAGEVAGQDFNGSYGYVMD